MVHAIARPNPAKHATARKAERNASRISVDTAGPVRRVQRGHRDGPALRPSGRTGWRCHGRLRTAPRTAPHPRSPSPNAPPHRAGELHRGRRRPQVGPPGDELDRQLHQPASPTSPSSSSRRGREAGSSGLKDVARPNARPSSAVAVIAKPIDGKIAVRCVFDIIRPVNSEPAADARRHRQQHQSHLPRPDAAHDLQPDRQRRSPSPPAWPRRRRPSGRSAKSRIAAGSPSGSSGIAAPALLPQQQYQRPDGNRHQPAHQRQRRQVELLRPLQRHQQRGDEAGEQHHAQRGPNCSRPPEPTRRGRRNASTAATAPNGMLTRNTDGQPNCCVSQPPATGPKVEDATKMLAR